MNNYRNREIQDALESYYSDMELINIKRLEMYRQEIEAWKHLKQVIFADQPEKLFHYFQRKE